MKKYGIMSMLIQPNQQESFIVLLLEMGGSACKATLFCCGVGSTRAVLFG